MVRPNSVAAGRRLQDARALEYPQQVCRRRTCPLPPVMLATRSRSVPPVVFAARPSAMLPVVLAADTSSVPPVMVTPFASAVALVVFATGSGAMPLVVLTAFARAVAVIMLTAGSGAMPPEMVAHRASPPPPNDQAHLPGPALRPRSTAAPGSAFELHLVTNPCPVNTYPDKNRT